MSQNLIKKIRSYIELNKEEEQFIRDRTHGCRRVVIFSYSKFAG